ncbi:MAG: response regulator [Calothrix sp. MO_192.B10]|nr:response regulator [Calothrix sp. MO_192.B10]
MTNPVAEINKIHTQMMKLAKSKKPKILVVDDEVDNLDLLYRTFRRDFHVLKAYSGVEALEILAEEGEVAVIISDQRMPEMKGTEFLRKTLPQFPNTVRIILTGFTDIEDLVDAINAGQVYKYITKPWEPEELKVVVDRAVETYDLLKQRTEELERANSQMALLAVLVQVAQQNDDLATTLNQIATAFGQSFAVDNCILQTVEDGTLIAQQGTYSAVGDLENWLEQDPLVKDAIATGQIQVSVNIPKDKQLAGVSHYSDFDIKAHLVIPVTYRGKATAVLSLQWKQPTALKEDELKLIHLSAQLVGIVIDCTCK